jgi:endonuclease/exonuclease/phosphatase family metal-dependent hydrolase
MARGRIQVAGQRDIVVVGTVLPWGSDDLFRGSKSFCEALHAQEIGWTKGADAHDSALVVAGDFNQSLPFQRYYGTIDGAQALDAVLEKHDLHCLTKSADPPSEDPPEIDHICVSLNSTKSSSKPVVEYRKSPTFGEKPLSDHSITVVHIQLI